MQTRALAVANLQDTAEIVIDIDGQIAALIAEINASPNEKQQTEFVDAFQNVVLDQLLGPFGLTRAMFDDRNGGPVTTLHNFEKGVVANAADQARHDSWQEAQHSSISRTDYNEAMKAHEDMFDGKVDGYSGRNLPEGPSIASRDHVVSVSEIERSAKGHVGQTREERVKTATQKDNLVLTSNSLNSSKQDSDLKEWMARTNESDNSKTNAEYYEVDPAAAEAAYKKAHKAVDGKQDRAVLKKQAGELAIEASSAAGKLALRRMLGMLLKDVITGVIADIRHLAQTGFESLESLAALAKKRIDETWERVKAQWAEYLKEGAGAAIAGLLSSTVTVLINAFVTTVKNIVSMIREAVLSLVRAIRMIVSPPPGATPQQIAIEVMKILAASVAACIGIALEEVIAKAMQAIPILAPIAADVAPVIASILTGALTLFAVLAFDRMRERIAFRNQALADVHRGQSVNLLQIKRTFIALQSAHAQLALTQQVMGRQFDETKREVDDARVKTRQSLIAYGGAVTSLDDVLKGLE